MRSREKKSMKSLWKKTVQIFHFQCSPIISLSYFDLKNICKNKEFEKLWESLSKHRKMLMPSLITNFNEEYPNKVSKMYTQRVLLFVLTWSNFSFLDSSISCRHHWNQTEAKKREGKNRESVKMASMHEWQKIHIIQRAKSINTQFVFIFVRLDKSSTMNKNWEKVAEVRIEYNKRTYVQIHTMKLKINNVEKQKSNGKKVMYMKNCQTNQINHKNKALECLKRF